MDPVETSAAIGDIHVSTGEQNGLMPFVRCPKCSNRAHSAAASSGKDTCPACGASVTVARGTDAPEAGPEAAASRKALRQVDEAVPTEE
jgi:ribosomal protein S27E